ncbi:MAG: PAS domain S-box protein, partial [Methylocapsa sp.]|nr:PAS domain S-box protein [Methylocapsa sp.]
MTNWLYGWKALNGAAGTTVRNVLEAGRRRPLWRSLGTATLVFATAFFFRILCHHELGTRLEYATFCPAVAITAMAAGFSAGALATVFSASAAAFWIDTSPLADPGDYIGLGIFILSCALIVYVTGAFHRAHRRAIVAEEQTKNAKKEARENEARLELFFAHAPAALAMFDREMRYIAASHRWLADYGLEGRDLRGQSHYELFPRLPERWREVHRRGLQGEVIGADEDAFERPSGRMRWLRWEVRPWHDSAGTVGGIVIFAEDITARKMAENALKQSEAHAREQEARFRSIFESAPEGMVLADNERRVILVNPAIERIFGYEPGELEGAPVAKLFEQSDAWKPTDRTGEARRAPQTARFERKDGEIFTGETLAVPCRDNEGNILGYLRTIRDVPQEEKRRQERQRTQRLEALGQLTGGIAHDFNNQLTVISGNLQLLEMRLQDQTLARYLREIDRAVEMGERLSQRLMTFASQRKLTPSITNLNELVSNLLELLQRTIGAQIAITTVLADELWLTRVDVSEIENAVLNLAINARDAMPEGGKLLIKTRNVMIDEKGQHARQDIPPGRYVSLSVSDTGSGMPPEVLARVFEPFFTTKEYGKGTGLGLASIYGFVRQSGGEIRIYSEAGRGTTINIYLPEHAGRAGRADSVS